MVCVSECTIWPRNLDQLTILFKYRWYLVIMQKTQWLARWNYRLLLKLTKTSIQRQIAKLCGVLCSKLSVWVTNKVSGQAHRNFVPARKYIRTAKHSDTKAALVVWFKNANWRKSNFCLSSLRKSKGICHISVWSAVNPVMSRCPSCCVTTIYRKHPAPPL